jgi:hypothetical protein
MPPPPAATRYDYEYVRHGTANLFMISEPLLRWRAVEVTARQAAVNFTELLGWLVEDVHADADQVVLVTDSLNAHGPKEDVRRWHQEGESIGAIARRIGVSRWVVRRVLGLRRR